MALITDSLSIWDISFRWAGYDPDWLYLKYPLTVKDNFKILFQAVLDGEVFCETLTLAKRPHDSQADPRYYSRTYIDEIYDCIAGVRYNKKLLKWAIISRYDFREWCERRAIPLPEFWYPPGWNDEFEEPAFGTRATWATHVEPDEPGGFSLHFEIPDEIKAAQRGERIINPSEDSESPPLKPNSKVKLCSQQIASQLWKEHPDRTIAEMMRDEIILKYSGAANYGESALRKWLSEIAPVHIKGKRGRPRNKPDADTK